MKPTAFSQSVIDAVIQAGRLTDRPGDTDLPSSALKEAETRRRRPMFTPRCATLLAHILTHARTATPCVMFVACGTQERATPIALGTAQAAASLLGRTLMLNANLNLEEVTANECSVSYGSDTDDTPLPDAFTPQLYHRHLAHQPADIALLFGHSRDGRLAALAAPFRFVAIDAPAPNVGPAASALAPFCLGSVLVVHAGSSKRALIKEAALQITACGGTIIGSVLYNAPGKFPSWVGA